MNLQIVVNTEKNLYLKQAPPKKILAKFSYPRKSGIENGFSSLSLHLGLLHVTTSFKGPNTIKLHYRVKEL